MRDRSSDSTLVKVVTPQLSSGPLGRRKEAIMTRSFLIKLALVLVGAYFAFLGFWSFVRLYLATGSNFWNEVATTNSFFDAGILLFGCAFIFSILKGNKYRMPFIKITAVLSGFASVIQVLVFVSLLSREHTTLDVLRYVFELLCCLFALFITVLVWNKPQVISSSGLTSRSS